MSGPAPGADAARGPAPPPRLLAFLGKGGAGKTVLSCLAARRLAAAGRRVLLVDADPAAGLRAAVGLDEGACPSLGEVRDRLVATARATPDAAALAHGADYLLLEALGEVHGLGFLAMGPGRAAGCYCAVNRLLRDALDALGREFDHVVVDAEAGLEQVSRQVFRRIDAPVLVTDGSVRGAQAALAIAATAARLGQPAPRGVVFNRTTAPDPALVARLAAAGVPLLGAVPLDAEVARHDAAGRPLLDLPDAAPALAAVGAVLRRLALPG